MSTGQPDVWPIVRLELRANVEIGAKPVISNVDGYAITQKSCCDDFNEVQRRMSPQNDMWGVWHIIRKRFLRTESAECERIPDA
ncbi:MAG: hypothetical protein OWQ59_07425 [Alicyclobacillaceae bacterium]|nr:hypothetical protein [Alicyclobacillaceae bacterium]